MPITDENEYVSLGKVIENAVADKYGNDEKA